MSIPLMVSVKKEGGGGGGGTGEGTTLGKAKSDRHFWV